MLHMTGDKLIAMDYYFQEHLNALGIKYFIHCIKRPNNWSSYFSNKKWARVHDSENIINDCPIINHNVKTGINLISHEYLLNSRKLISKDYTSNSITRRFSYNNINQAVSVFHDFGSGTEVLCLGWNGGVPAKKNIFDIISHTLSMCKRLHTYKEIQYDSQGY